MGLLVDLRFGVTGAYLEVVTTQGTKQRGYYVVQIRKGADNFPLQAEDTHFGWLDDYDVETPNWKQAYQDFKARWKRGLLPPIYTGVYEEDGTPVEGFVGQDDINAARTREAARRAKPPADPEPSPPIEPENVFADLMLADETIEDAKARLSQRLKELRHYLIAPEIKVNEDGSVGLTAGEQSELQDLERRQTLGRWLEA